MATEAETASLSPGAAVVAPEVAPPSEAERAAALWLTNVSHIINHFQNNMVSVLYPVIMAEMGFGPAQLGLLTAARSLLGSGCQALYGFLAPFVRRSRLLGAGNLILGVGTFASGLTSTFPAFLGARVLSSAGTSAQHPVGSSLLSAYFPEKRGTILALNTSVAGIGGLIAPMLVGFLLMVMGWRQIFLIVAFLSLAMGVVYFFFSDRVAAAAGSSRRERLSQGKASYRRVLHNRNLLVVSGVMMVGAAGRGEGVNVTFIGPHLVTDLALSIAMAGVALTVLQLGGIAGPIGFGWLSDRLSRRGVLQASLLLSALATWWLAAQGAYLPVLLLNLLVYGTVTYSRNSLTQALVADSIPDGDRDAAFSVYYFIGFIAGPIWSAATGYIMETLGFSVAWTVLGFSYLAGMLLMFLVVDPRELRATSARPLERGEEASRQ